MLITTFLSNRIPAVMACTSFNVVGMIDVLPLPELSKLDIKLIGMKEDNLFVIQCYNNESNKTTD